MQRVGHELLARAGLADDQHVRARRRDEIHLTEQRLHRPGAADEPAELFTKPLLELVDAFAQLGFLDQRGDALAQLFQIDRFGQIVVGTAFHGVHGRLDRTVTRDHQHADLRIDLARLLEHAEPVGSGQHEVGDDQADLAVLAQQLQSGLGVGKRLHGIALARQCAHQTAPVALVVLDDDDPRFASHGEPKSKL